MSLTVSRFGSEDYKWWDDYIWQADNGNIFHTRRFLSYHPQGRFTDHSLIFKKKNSVRAVLPAIEMTMDKDKVLYSHRGASYGGFVYRDLGIAEAFELVEALKAYAKETGFTRILITLPPIVYMNRYSNYLDFAMLQNGFRYLKREISSVVQLPTDPEQVLSLFKSEARTATRKSIKSGVQIRLSEDYDTYYEILKQNGRIAVLMRDPDMLKRIIKTLTLILKL